MHKSNNHLIIKIIIALMIGLGNVYTNAGQTGGNNKPESCATGILVINLDPVVISAENKRLHEVVRELTSFLGYDPKYLASALISDMDKATGGKVRFVIKEWIDLNEMPKSVSNEHYKNPENYIADFKTALKWGKNYWAWPGWKEGESDFDSDHYIKKYNVFDRVNKAEIKQVWFFMPPNCKARAYESQMIGDQAYWCNAPPVQSGNVKPFMVFYFSYEREEGCALENMGHAFESIMQHLYGRWDYNISLPQMNTWEKFTLYDKVKPGEAACGNVHFAPNSIKDYDWGNKTKVTSNYLEWVNYPKCENKKELVDCSVWGNGDMRLHHLWWFSCIPKAEGKDADGTFKNWWEYFIKPELAKR